MGGSDSGDKEQDDNDEYEYADEYEEEEEDGSDDGESASEAPLKRKKDKGKAKEKDSKKRKEVDSKKKEKRKDSDKKKSKKDKDNGRRDKKKAKDGEEAAPKKDKKRDKAKERRSKKRRRSPSSSCDDYYSEDYSPEPSRRRGRREERGKDRRRDRGKEKRRRSSSRRQSPQQNSRGDDFRNFGTPGRAPMPYPMMGGYPPPMGYPPMGHAPAMPSMSRIGRPEGSKMSLAEVCDSAGRGDTSGNTAEDTEISVFGPKEDRIRDPDHFDSFDEIKDFPRDVRHALKDAGFPSPSQIQAYCWPLGLREKDVIGIAATGSGKTLAFLLPAFASMIDEGLRPERDGPGLLVLAPTRELAQQIETEAHRFGQKCGMRCVAMYGGSPKGAQISKYRSGVHCIVACPGRLNDFLEGGQIKLERCSRLVLDEADRMLDMGFEPQIRKIMDRIPRKRHTLFFTATWPREVRQLASEILDKPYKVMIGNRDELKGNQDITQLVEVVDQYQKNDKLVSIVREAGLCDRDCRGKALVFCNTKRMCEQISQYLQRFGVPVASIHGDKDQRQREDALNGLKSGHLKVLVATDVAARGLDIKGVGLVLNYDPANNTEDYVHRIGRTARAGAKGFAITLVTSAEAGKVRGIVEVMERTDQHVSDDLRRMAGSGGGGGGKSRHSRGKGSGKSRGKGPVESFGMARGGDRDRRGASPDRYRPRSRSLSF